jgi:Lon protease-like protein
MIQQLPLFPLGTVLFPGATLNLHIFEERYRTMIGQCLEQNSPFGVIYLRSGDEVAEGRAVSRPTEVASIGTVAQISANVRLEDGRYLLTATGLRRFSIHHILQRTPYIIASVIELPEESGPQVAVAARELRAAYGRYWRAMSTASGTPVEVEDLPDAPEAMAYQLAERLQVPYHQKQRWLEKELIARLRGLADELLSELAILPQSSRGGLSNLN